MKQYDILIITVILAITYTGTLAEKTVETLTDSSNTTQKNGKFETRNKKFGERLKAAESPVITATESLVTTMVPTVTTQTEPKVLTTTEPPVTTKNESLLTNTTEQQMTIEIEQLVSTAMEPPVITKVESLLITTAEEQITTETEQLVSTAAELPVTTTEVVNSTQREIEIIPIHTHDVSRPNEEGLVECRIPVIKPPDFSAPGRRISKQKCYDYVWNIKGRQLKRYLILDCLYKNVSKSGTFYGEDFDEYGYPSEFPHMGALGWKSSKTNWVFKCASSLISERFLLTAAHCSTATSEDGSITDPEPKIVRMGAFDLTVPYYGDDYDIAKIIVHPKYYYRFPGHYFDIALIELKKDVKFTANVHPACLWGSSESSDLGADVLLAGWGDLKISYKFEPRVSTSVSQKLQVGTIELIDSQTCDKLLEPYQDMDWQGLQEYQICAGNLSEGIDSCQGNSGGLLQLPTPLPEDETNEKMKHIFGVTSFTLDIDCEFGDTPGIYTKVSSFIDWIEDIVWPQ